MMETTKQTFTGTYLVQRWINNIGDDHREVQGSIVTLNVNIALIGALFMTVTMPLLVDDKKIAGRADRQHAEAPGEGKGGTPWRAHRVSGATPRWLPSGHGAAGPDQKKI